MDESNAMINITLWGQTAPDFDLKQGSPIIFKAARLGDYGGRSLNASGN